MITEDLGAVRTMSLRRRGDRNSNTVSFTDDSTCSRAHHKRSHLQPGVSAPDEDGAVRVSSAGLWQTAWKSLRC